MFISCSRRCFSLSSQCASHGPFWCQSLPVAAWRAQGFARAGRLAAFRDAEPVRLPPWAISFDLKERDTLWTDSNKGRLVKYVAAQSMGISADDAQARLEQLALVLPDLQSQLHTMHPSVLSALLQDVEAVAEKMLALRRLFPAANVSGMVCAQPRRFVTHSIERITRDKAALQALLGIDAVKADSIVERFPSFLDQQHVLEVLEEMGRFMGGTAEGLKATLANDPSWLLRVERGQQRLGINPDSQPGELADPPPGPGRAQGTNDNVGGGQIGGVDESAGDGGDNKQADDSAG